MISLLYVIGGLSFCFVAACFVGRFCEVGRDCEPEYITEIRRLRHPYFVEPSRN